MPPLTGPLMVAWATGLLKIVVVVAEDEPLDEEHAVATTTNPAITTPTTRPDGRRRFMVPRFPFLSSSSLSHSNRRVPGGAYDRPMSRNFVRRVVTGIDEQGRHVIVEDGASPNTFASESVAVSEVLWVDGPDISTTANIDRSSPGFPLEPPAGGLSARVIRMPGIPPGADPDTTWLRVDGDDPDAPGMHATDTLDLMVVLEGSVVMGLDDGERTIGAGEFVVQRGTRHRWRPADAEGWTYFVTMLRPNPDVTGEIVGVKSATTGDRPVRRVVTGSPVIAGGCADARSVGGTTITDIWHTGGALARADQGGDPAGAWALEPVTDGAWFRLVELTPAPADDAGWHRTETIDLDIVLSGRVLLELPGGVSTELGPGDVVVQRGTDHRWTALGDDRFAMACVMLDAARRV